ncbi:MAG: DUF2066 domain-containing protein [Hyphomicrobiales bacterium]
MSLITRLSATVDTLSYRESGFSGISPTIMALMIAIFGLTSLPLCACADPFTVSGIKVDIKAKSASSAKHKALGEAQGLAFRRMIRRISTADAAQQFNMTDPALTGPLMGSMTIDREQSGPGEYIAQFTIFFLPDKVRELLGDKYIPFAEQVAKPVLLLPIWNGLEGPMLWNKANPWRSAWAGLDIANALTPVTLPAGDLSDRSTLTARQALAGDSLRLDALKARYDAQDSLIALAVPVGDDAIWITVTGNGANGPIHYEETVIAPADDRADALERTAQQFLMRMQDRWKRDLLHLYTPPAPQHTMKITVSFSNIAQWARIRSRLLSSSLITKVDTISLSGKAAVIDMTYRYDLAALRQNLKRNGLTIRLVDDSWILRLAD